VGILAAAARDARERAREIAGGTGSRVGGMRSEEMGVLQITAADANNVSDCAENGTKSPEKEITAVVHVTYALNESRNHRALHRKVQGAFSICPGNSPRVPRLLGELQVNGGACLDAGAAGNRLRQDDAVLCP
jgi:hypothetical protein